MKSINLLCAIMVCIVASASSVLASDCLGALDTIAPPNELKLPPAPPPPSSLMEQEIFRVVEQMPRFPGCEDKATEEDKNNCATPRMLEYLYKNLKYPALARENGVEGRVLLNFIVEKDGTLSNIKIVEDIGSGCGEAAVDVIRTMIYNGKTWIPGKQGGRSVRVLFTLPVKFRMS